MRPLIALGATLLALAAAAGPAAGYAQPDPSFGSDGVATVSFPTYANGLNVVPLSDGRILLGGHDEFFAAARLNADGSLDPTFGTNGTAEINADASGFDGNGWASAMAIQPDGRILLAGDAQDSTYTTAAAVVRLTADGQRDPTFGTNGVIRFRNSPDAAPDVSGIAVQADGKILLAVTGDDRELVRLNPDGSFDSSFDGDGIWHIAPAEPTAITEQTHAVLLLPSGKSIEAGTTHHRGELVYFVARHNADGSLDGSFGTDGTKYGPRTTATGYGYPSLALQRDGKLLLAGDTYEHGEERAAVARYLPDGRLDQSWGLDGFVYPYYGGDAATGVMADGEGRVVITGVTPQEGRPPFVQRFLPNGQLDDSFGRYGTLWLPDGVSVDIAQDSAGRLLTAGSSPVSANAEAPMRVVRITDTAADITPSSYAPQRADGSGSDAGVFSAQGGRPRHARHGHRRRHRHRRHSDAVAGRSRPW